MRHPTVSPLHPPARSVRNGPAWLPVVWFQLPGSGKLPSRTSPLKFESPVHVFFTSTPFSQYSTPTAAGLMVSVLVRRIGIIAPEVTCWMGIPPPEKRLSAGPIAHSMIGASPLVGVYFCAWALAGAPAL